MEEINVKTNNTELKIEINGQPQYDNIPTCDKNIFVHKMERVITEIFTKYMKRKK